MDTTSTTMPHVVIVGGGFGGLAAANALDRAPVRVTLVDRNNHHTFQPLLYQVATAGLEAPHVGYPLRATLRRRENSTVLMAQAETILPDRNCVRLSTGDELSYDYLILATGMTPGYFGHPEWEAYAPGLKSVADAITMRYRILGAFERAEQARDEEERRANMSFVVIGGGPTGVELAGSIAELARYALWRDFRHIDTTKARVLLIEAGPAILPTYPPDLRQKAVEQLSSLGVQVQTSSPVEAVDEDGVVAGGERVVARTVLWAAGMVGTPLARSLGAPLDRQGRVRVTPTLNPPERPNVFVLGDLVALEQDGRPLPGLAPMAIQSGRYAARAILRSIDGEPLEPFRYRNKGELATIGRSRAVGIFPGGVKLSGFFAWLAYLGVHLLFLLGFRNRVRVFFTWAWSYFTYKRGARLIPSSIPAPSGKPLHMTSTLRTSEGPDAPESERAPAPPLH